MKRIIVLIVVAALICNSIFIVQADEQSERKEITINLGGREVPFTCTINDKGQYERLVCEDIFLLPEKITLENVVSLGFEAFKDANIKEVTLVDTEIIGSSAFYNCRKLEKVFLEKCKTIGPLAFGYCGHLFYIYYPNTMESLAPDALYNTVSLYNIEFEDGITTIPEFSCREAPIESIVIPDSVESIGRGAFTGCKRLQELDCKNIKRIERFGLSGCVAIKELNLENIEYMGEGALHKCTGLDKITIPAAFESDNCREIIGMCTNLKEVVLEEGIKEIPDGMFKNSCIETIKLPSTVNKIGKQAFMNCKLLKSINLDNISVIPDEAFSGCEVLEDFDIKNIEEIGGGAFTNCTALKSITLPAGLKKGGESAVFNGCTSLKTIILEEGLTTIPTYMCAETEIENIEIPESVKSIMYSAFENCRQLNNPDLKNVEEIQWNAFTNCEKLSKIVLPKTLWLGGAYKPVFSGCSNLKEIEFEEGTKIIPAYICADTNIEKAVIPSSVQLINNNAFSSCTELKEVIFKSEDTMILDNPRAPVFDKCSQDLTVTLYSNTQAGDYCEKNNIKVIYNGLIKQGDVNADGEIDTNDALLILKHIVDIEKLNEEQLVIADVDKNSKVSAQDSLKVLQRSVGIIKAFSY